MKTVVISQPMLFPWVGMFEQIRLADAYVHYDDVQFSKGSFTNRVQIKTLQGIKWLTLPLKNLKLGQKISEIEVDNSKDWRNGHLSLLKQSYAAAPYSREMLDLVSQVYSHQTSLVSEIAVISMMAVHRYFNFQKPLEFYYSSQMNIPGESSRRVLDVVKQLGGNVYITGHGAKNYLDHPLFEQEGVQVEYINYQKKSYPQLHGEFTPFVSTLDLIANCGTAGVSAFSSNTLPWKEFIA